MNLSNNYILHTKHEETEYIQFKKLLEYEDILTHAYSVGIDKNFRTSITNKEDYNRAITDYEKLCKQLKLNSMNLVKTNQTHSARIKVVNKKINLDKPDFNMEEYDNTDGLITNKNNLILSTTNADCILLFLFDPNNKVIANIHSGWKGTLQRISVNAIEKMHEEYGSRAEDIIVCMCPSIRRCHFEVENDVELLFENEFKDIDTSICVEQKMENKWNIDTIEINKHILQSKVVKKDNIIESGICSVCNRDVIHSYRAEGKEYKLNTAIIALK